MSRYYYHGSLFYSSLDANGDGKVFTFWRVLGVAGNGTYWSIQVDGVSLETCAIQGRFNRVEVEENVLDPRTVSNGRSPSFSDPSICEVCIHNYVRVGWMDRAMVNNDLLVDRLVRAMFLLQCNPIDAYSFLYFNSHGDGKKLDS